MDPETEETSPAPEAPEVPVPSPELDEPVPAPEEPATLDSEVAKLEAEAAELDPPAAGDPNVIEVAAEDEGDDETNFPPAPKPVESITRADVSGAGKPRRRGSGSKEHPRRW